MRKVILAMQMTLDAYVAGPNDELDWLIGGDEEWEEMFKDLESVDTCLLGAKMYPGYSGYWRSLLDSKETSGEVEYARWADRTPHIVFSTSMKSVDWPNTRISSDVVSELRKLKESAGKDMIVWGGASFASSLIRLGLIDEYRITLNPTVLGSGKAIFNTLDQRLKLTLTGARPLKSGNVILNYAR